MATKKKFTIIQKATPVVTPKVAAPKIPIVMKATPAIAPQVTAGMISGPRLATSFVAPKVATPNIPIIQKATPAITPKTTTSSGGSSRTSSSSFSGANTNVATSNPVVAATTPAVTPSATQMTPAEFIKYLTDSGTIASDADTQARVLALSTGQPDPGATTSDILNNIPVNTAIDDKINKAEDDLLKLKEAAANETDEDIRQRITDLFQREIDALNGLYAQQKQEATKAGLANLGTNRASQARFGLLGSSFGTAETKGIEQETVQKKESIDVANQAATAPIYNQIATEVLKARQDKRAAQAESAEAYIAYLKNQKTQKETTATNAIKSLILAKANPTDKDFKDMAKQIGVDPTLFKQEYLAAKQEEEANIAAQEKAGLKANADITKPLDVGDYTYIYNTETGTWENQGFNKKATATGTGDMSTRQNVVFNSIITKNNAIDSANATFNVAKNTAERLKANPENAQTQLSNLYQYVKTLDSNSAVREGEIGLARATNSLMGDINAWIEGKKAGTTVGKELAIKMADEAIVLADAWLRESQRQKNNLRAQAMTNDIEDEYLKTVNYASQLNQDVGRKTIEDYRAEFPQATDEELQALMEEESN